MISDILADASEEITRYLKDRPDAYPHGTPIVCRILAVQRLMDDLRRVLDRVPDKTEGDAAMDGRNYYVEAMAILAGSSMLMPEKAHLEAIQRHHECKLIRLADHVAQLQDMILF